MVSLKVYDFTGREVEQLVNTVQPNGIYDVHFDASNLASGVYLYQLTAGSQVFTQKTLAHQIAELRIGELGIEDLSSASPNS